MNFRNQIDKLHAAKVIDRDGDKVGSVEQVFVHNGTDNPSWVTVNTGLFGTKETFIPLDDASFEGDEIRVPYEKQFIKDAPQLDERGEISEEEENELYRYYGVKDPGYGTAGNNTHVGDHDRRDLDGDHHDSDHLDRDRHDHDHDRHDLDREHHDRDGEKVTLHEERVNVGTEKVQTGKLRLRKYVVNDTKTVEVPVEREEFVVERTPADGRSGGQLGEDDVEVTLTEERPVVSKETVATEDVHVGKRTVHDTEKVQTNVAREEVEVEGADGHLNDRRDGVDRDRDGRL